jgi:hypothetical protein
VTTILFERWSTKNTLFSHYERPDRHAGKGVIRVQVRRVKLGATTPSLVWRPTTQCPVLRARTRVCRVPAPGSPRPPLEVIGRT